VFFAGEAGALIGIKARASEKLWKLYVVEGVEGLLRIPAKGRPEKLTEAALQVELDESRVATLKQVCRFVVQTHGIVLTEVTMHYYFRREKIKKKTGRPTHVHKDGEKEETVKKKSFPT
jgi:transposase